MTIGPGAFGTAVWSSPGWQAAALAWLDERLAAAGITRTGAAEHPHVRAWATAVRVPTDHVDYWLKACGPDTAFEVPLYRVLAELVPGDVLAPLAADPARGWIVLPDGGRVLGDQLAGADLARALGAALVQYGRLQRALMPGVPRMLAAGVTDMGPPAMLDAFDRALALTRRDLDAGEPDRDRERRHAQIAAARDEVAGWCGALTRSALPASLDHNDLHPRNMFWDPRSGRARFFDWGDAVIAHPFAAMLVPLAMVHELLGGVPATAPFRAIRDAYLQVFADLAPDEDLPATLETACRVAKIARAHTWDRAVSAAGRQGDPSAARFRFAALDTLSAVLDADYLTVG